MSFEGRLVFPAFDDHEAIGAVHFLQDGELQICAFAFAGFAIFREEVDRSDPRQSPIRRSLGAAAAALIIAVLQVRALPLERPVRIRHSAVRILSAQPATGVSPRGFQVLREVSTFPEVSGQEPGLW